jgi:ABC-type sugar transport system permease subunit
MASSTLTPPASQRSSPFNMEKLRENLTGYIFIAPAVIIILLFGIFPIVYAAYMSVFDWTIRPRYTFCLPNLATEYSELARNQRNTWTETHQVWQLDFNTQVQPNLSVPHCFDNYGRIIGDAGGLVLFVGGFLVMLAAYILWMRAFAGDEHTDTPLQREPLNPFIKLALAAVALIIALVMVGTGWTMMFSAGDQKFWIGLVYTLYYAIVSVPVQLALGLILAYALFQNLRGKTLFRMLFFLPYITPAVAAATVFRIIFSPRQSSLANQFLGVVGLEPQKWIGEADPFVNALFGWDLHGFFAGPSMSMVSIIILGIWMYVGYNAIIYLAGLGNIPTDLYEAARVDGASEWHLFRYITLPLLSPITFYLSILGFIGTFKSFNSIYVMRSPEARGTTDTIAIVVFDTFKQAQRYGEATAQAILLMLIILAITQFQRSFLERRVFYG